MTKPLLHLNALSASERQFIQTHLTTDVRALLLRTTDPALPIKLLAEQIVARQKAREKLPTWYANDALIFPPLLSVEQASSEQTARFKASIIGGRKLLDLTGGMGVDTWAFAQQVDEVLYVERQTDLADRAAYNLPLLGSTNVDVRVGDGIAMLSQAGFPVADWIYLDPHRRTEQGGRVVKLADCEPDLTQAGVLSTLFTRTIRILIKVSPLLDIGLAVQALANRVESVYIVASQGEVKEILFTLVNQIVDKETIKINSVNLTREGIIEVAFAWGEEASAAVSFGNPQHYLYEPNAAVLKAGAFRLLASRFGLTKLAPHSHLYTSNELRSDFPGRIFTLVDIVKPDSKAVKKALPDLQANLTVRNFPQTVAQLRKQLALREGGSVYMLATTLLNGDKRLLITQKINDSLQLSQSNETS